MSEYRNFFTLIWIKEIKQTATPAVHGRGWKVGCRQGLVQQMSLTGKQKGWEGSRERCMLCLMICSKRQGGKPLIRELCLICLRIKGTSAMYEDESWPGNSESQPTEILGLPGPMSMEDSHRNYGQDCKPISSSAWLLRLSPSLSFRRASSCSLGPLWGKGSSRL